VQFVQTRRAILVSAASILTSAAIAAEEKPWLLNITSSTRNAWVAWWIRGGQAYARSIENSQRYLLRESEGAADTALKQVTTAVDDYSGKLILNFDSPGADATRDLANICKDKKVFFVTQFNKPDDLHPWGFDPYYVAHIWNDDYQFGRRTAEVLLETIEHRGSIVALKGRNVDRAARERFRGLQDVLAGTPRVQLLDHQDANWAASSAFDITRWLLARFGAKIRGIWAANDSMAIGAIEALRTRGLAGALPVTGMDVEEDAIAALRSGELTASLIVDSFWCGGIGLSLAYQAAMGTIDPTRLVQDKRELSSQFYVVTKANVEKFVTYRRSSQILRNWSDPDASRNSDLP
jgi:ribose transport system substrate-binding protein